MTSICDVSSLVMSLQKNSLPHNQPLRSGNRYDVVTAARQWLHWIGFVIVVFAASPIRGKLAKFSDAPMLRSNYSHYNRKYFATGVRVLLIKRIQIQRSMKAIFIKLKGV